MNQISKSKDHELIELNHNHFIEEPDTYMQQITANWLKNVLDTPTSDHDLIKKISDNLTQFGQLEQHAFWDLNNSLKHPLEKLIRETETGEVITKSLRELQTTILKIKPPKQTLWGKFLNMFTLLFSLKESTWHIWVEAYPTHKKKILKITKNLEGYKRQLNHDNSSLLNDKMALQNLVIELEHSFDTLSFFDKKASDETQTNLEINSDTRALLSDNLIPAMHERLIELQQQLVIARQSVMTWDLFIRQNKSQIKLIDKAVHTTVNAIKVTASIYMLKQKNELIKQNSQSDNYDPKEARELIDQALIQMKEIQASQNSNLNSYKN